jgi:isopentenyl-diphosphate delta-isomerase
MNQQRTSNLVIEQLAPGKLYLAGEYAILTPGNPALLMAVNRFVTARLTVHTGQSGKLTSSLFAGKSVEWTRETHSALQIMGDISDFSFAAQAVYVADQFAIEVGCTPLMYSIALSSDLDAKDGRKLGLGSSAAVCVACVKAVMSAYGLQIDPITVYKLAACAHWKVQGNGSLGDVAASSLGGFVFYCSPDRQWLSDALSHESFAHVVSLAWPQLELRALHVSPQIHIMTGWTGTPASTEKLVAQQQSHSSDHFEESRFIRSSAQAVYTAAHALESGDFSRLAAAIELNRTLLEQLAHAKSLPIEIPAITRGIQVARSLGAVAKSSGAGGGDCLIAFYPAYSSHETISQSIEDRLHRQWSHVGIVPLNLQVAVCEHAVQKQGDRSNQDASTGSVSAEQSVSQQLAQKREERKEDHLRLAQELYSASRRTDFDSVHLVRPTLPEMSVADVSLDADFCGHQVALPVMINAMTGGTDHSTQINIHLARAARACHIPIAFGSASIVAQDPHSMDGFLQARQAAGDTPIVVNINPSTPTSVLEQLIEQLEPVAVQIHVNAVQEVVMPEGDRNFRWIDDLRALAQCASQLGCPVIVKEVGFGFDGESLKRLQSIGIRCVDCAGSGGTDFAAIENMRNQKEDWSWLTGCGLSAVQSLLNARLEHTPLTLVASGGIRNPLDILKSFALGASFIGVSGVILHELCSAPDLDTGQTQVENLLHTWKEQLTRLCALYGISSLRQAPDIPVWLTGNVKDYWKAARHHFIRRDEAR